MTQIHDAVFQVMRDEILRQPFHVKFFMHDPRSTQLANTDGEQLIREVYAPYANEPYCQAAIDAAIKELSQWSNHLSCRVQLGDPRKVPHRPSALLLGEMFRIKPIAYEEAVAELQERINNATEATIQQWTQENNHA